MSDFQCEVCGKDMPDHKPMYCCNAYDCPCQGQPEYPPICSDKCGMKLMGIEDQKDD